MINPLHHTNVKIEDYYFYSGMKNHLMLQNLSQLNFFVELEPEPPEKEVESNPKLSLNAMNSATPSGTMRFTGTIKGQPVKILLDGGSDDNFIQPRVAKFL